MRFYRAILLPLLALAQLAFCAEDYYKVRSRTSPLWLFCYNAYFI
jgi:hypothetical protein